MATKITFVTGKGGVGKSTVAAALAVASAKESASLKSDQKTLL
ncbi:MAG: ArsA-related P-loop ATPase, partial [Pseudobdellovibrionaceae bacterium]